MLDVYFKCAALNKAIRDYWTDWKGIGTVEDL